MAVSLFAAIEVGSYEIEMKIYEVGGKKGLKEIDRVAHVIDLGKSSYHDHYISFELIDEVCDVLYGFSDVMKGYNITNYRACATSAVRDAENCQNIVDRIFVRTGLKVDILSNSELRGLHNKGISLKEADFDRIVQDGTVQVDIGSGSTQLTLWNEGKLVATQNMNLGALRVRELMNRLAVNHSNYHSILEEYMDHELEGIQDIFFQNIPVSNMIVTGDYIGYMFRTMENRKNLSYITREEYYERYGKLLLAGDEDIEERFNVPQEYVGIMVPCMVMYKKMLDLTNAGRIYAPRVKLCDGMAAEYAQKNKKIMATRDFNEDILNASRAVAKRYMLNEEHVRFVEESSLRIFDVMKKIHGLGKRERLLLQIAAILHECGKYINLSFPGVCGYDIIMKTEIIGISHMERTMVANIVKCNTERVTYEELLAQGISRSNSLTVIKLSAILRLANGLDYTHQEKMRNLNMKLNEKELIITVASKGDITIELGLFEERKFLFEQAYGIRPVLRHKKKA